MDLEREHGADLEYVHSIPSKLSFLLGRGVLSNSFRRLITHLTSPIAAAPKISSNTESFAYKNTAFAGMQFMLAATAFGLSTSPMEGYDERRVCYSLKIPSEEYGVPFVVSIGYSAASKLERYTEPQEGSELEENSKYFPVKPRYTMEDIFFSNYFGENLNLEQHASNI